MDPEENAFQATPVTRIREQDFREHFMTKQTLFTGWPYSSWDYLGQSKLVAYFSMEIAITPAMPSHLVTVSPSGTVLHFLSHRADRVNAR